MRRALVLRRSSLEDDASSAPDAGAATLRFYDLEEGFAVLREFEGVSTDRPEVDEALQHALPWAFEAARSARGLTCFDVDVERADGQRSALLQLVISFDD